MLERTFPLVLALLSLLDFGINGGAPPLHTHQLDIRRCPVGTPVGKDCSPHTVPSTCPRGYHCYNPKQGLGLCCPNSAQATCQNGGIPNGRCIHSLINQCAAGFFCQDVPGDRTGVCCPTGNVQPSLGSCPVVDIATACVVLPGDHFCGSDIECQQGQRCCPHGCGKVCKYVGDGSYRPGK